MLLVLDEIATGFGRTGELFAADHAGITPDVMCVGKALTGGYLTLRPCSARPRSPPSCPAARPAASCTGPRSWPTRWPAAVGLASTGLLRAGGWRTDVPRIEALLREHLAPARDLPGVADVRVLGAIGVIQLTGPVDLPSATAAAVAQGVWLRPFRDLIYTMPPYVTDDEDVVRIARAAVSAAAAAG